MVNHRLLKFLISGGSAALIEYIVFLILNSLLRVDVIVANTVSFSCGLVVSYMLNRVWVFKSAADHKKQFASYLLLAVINLVLSNILVWLLVHVVVIAPFIAKFLTMGAVASWNYLIFSKIIFKK